MKSLPFTIPFSITIPSPFFILCLSEALAPRVLQNPHLCLQCLHKYSRNIDYNNYLKFLSCVISMHVTEFQSNVWVKNEVYMIHEILMI